LAHGVHIPKCWRCPCQLDGTCSASQWSNTISPCFLKHPFILFLKMQHMLVKVKRFVIDQPFSFISFLFHSSLKKYSLVIFIFCISVSVFILFIFNFCSWPFYKSFSCFLFSPSILICHVLLFQFSSYSFDF